MTTIAYYNDNKGKCEFNVSKAKLNGMIKDSITSGATVIDVTVVNEYSRVSSRSIYYPKLNMREMSTQSY